MNKIKITKALNELLKEDESLKYALATNLAKYGRPQSKKSDKPANLTKGLEKGREKYVKGLKKAGLDENTPVSVNINMDQAESIYKILADNFGEEHMKDMFTLGSLSLYNMLVKGGIAGIQETINENPDELNKIAKMYDLKHPHLTFDVREPMDRIDVRGSQQDLKNFGDKFHGTKIGKYEVFAVDDEDRGETVRIVKSSKINEEEGYSPQIGKTDGLTPETLSDILKSIIDTDTDKQFNEEKVDRCLRIARKEIPQSSAYRSGLIVKCRKGMIWKDKK